MDQNSAGRHPATNRTEGGRLEATLLSSLDRQSLHNGLRSWQISTYVGKIVNATGLGVFVGGQERSRIYGTAAWKIHASGCNYQLTIISVEEKATTYYASCRSTDKRLMLEIYKRNLFCM